MVGNGARLVLILLFCDFTRGSPLTPEEDDTCQLHVQRINNLVAKCSQRNRISGGDDSANLESVKNAIVGALLSEIQSVAAAVNQVKAEQNRFVSRVNQKFADIEEKLYKINSNLLEQQSSNTLNLKEVHSTLCLVKGLTLTSLPNGKKYYFSPIVKLRWKDAKTFCEKHKMHLASPKTPGDLHELRQKAKELFGTRNWWLSASDIGREPGDFRWHDGTPLAKDNNPIWLQNEPNDTGKGQETCVYFFTENDDKISDYPCTDDDNFICEFPDDQCQ